VATWVHHGEHTHRAGHDEGFSVDVLSPATWRGDHEEFEPGSISVWIDGNSAGPDLTADPARLLASLLVRAADWLERVDPA
jgi:hypothetical protein